MGRVFPISLSRFMQIQWANYARRLRERLGTRQKLRARTTRGASCSKQTNGPASSIFSDIKLLIHAWWSWYSHKLIKKLIINLDEFLNDYWLEAIKVNEIKMTNSLRARLHADTAVLTCFDQRKERIVRRSRNFPGKLNCSFLESLTILIMERYKRSVRQS
jgi:hypothetical protein